MALKDNFKDQIPQDGKRLYQVIDSNTGAIIHNNVQIARSNGNTQEGDKYGAAEVNEERKVINQLSNPNLLINGDFQVWQRGEEITVQNGQYCADRWKIYYPSGTATIKKVDNGLKIVGLSNGGSMNLIQILPHNPKLEGVKCKFTKSVNGIVTSEDFILHNDTGNDKNIMTRNIVELKVNDIVNYAKLEIGDIVTPLVSRPYAEELLSCQRYYQKYSYIMIRNLTNTLSVLYAGFPLRSVLRVKPTYFSTIETAQGSDISSDLADYYINDNCINYIQMKTSKLDCIMIKSLSLDAEIY